ncbi:hypothetical protein RchiOBHm_Chr5g0018701 [Rosa chinensis]|uniref:Uncharacterized protein n=1 Tax=Rosa chinensis TaxID=74649 RepID=A0A2P6Q6S7_ROSCH|nr:hypothetical protein RchiOBHm_Chr5g0018701 [Rosa chinensis]
MKSNHKFTIDHYLQSHWSGGGRISSHDAHIPSERVNWTNLTKHME